ncbi:MAG: hypothetical protein ACYS8K_09180, partial [Planctomycetota bacterium]
KGEQSDRSRVRRGAQAEAQDEAEAPHKSAPDPVATDGEESPTPKVVRLRPEGAEQRYPWATYRSPPPDEAAEREELVAAGETVQEREISAGFVLGIALVVITLACGMLIGRLQRKVRSLENRIGMLENVETQTAQAPPYVP